MYSYWWWVGMSICDKKLCCLNPAEPDLSLQLFIVKFAIWRLALFHKYLLALPNTLRLYGTHSTLWGARGSAVRTCM